MGIHRGMRDLWMVTFLLWFLFRFFQSYACDNHHDDNHHLHFHSNNGSSANDEAQEEQRGLQNSLVEIEECGFLPPSMEAMAEDANNMKAWQAEQDTKSIFVRSAQSYTIPIYFHIIQTSSTSGNVSDERIQQFVSYLNDSFSKSSVPFNFDFKRVTRTIRSDWGICNDSTTEIAMKTALKVGGADTLNVYICNQMYTSKGATISGFSTVPSSGSKTSIWDGIVIDNSSGFGRLNTLVHETGHFLGLWHTFGDNTCDPDSPGDLVDDTPQHISKASEVNCNTNPSTWDTCPRLAGLDPVDNYMNYSNNLLCRTRFTPGQKDRMIAQYELYRMTRRTGPSPTAPRSVPTAPRSPPTGPRSIPTAPRPSPIALRPVAVAPRPTPSIPRPSSTTASTPTLSCVELFAPCLANKKCCTGYCKPTHGVFSRILGGRCMY